MTSKRISDLEKFFKMKKIHVKIEYRFVERYNYNGIIAVFEEIIRKNSGCCFDLTGGKELVLTAMGAVSTKFDIPMVQFNVRTGNFIHVKNSCDIVARNDSSMKISECVMLNGGKVVYDGEGETKWNLTEEFRNDIENIWNICKYDCTLWNKQSKLLGFIENDDVSLDVNVDLDEMHFPNNDRLDEQFLRVLADNELILMLSYKNNRLRFKYKNEQIKRCILKAGNILELYIYMIAYEINDEKNNYYEDINIGVTLDWDGIVNRNRRFLLTETRNEVDVMLMKGMIPIFISCKNGVAHKEALYELFSVAEKFGGKYSKKILVTTCDKIKDKSFDYIIKRAHDMNIRIIYGIDGMSKKEIKKKLKIYAK